VQLVNVTKAHDVTKLVNQSLL
jgi:hypothetical protein